MKTLHKPTSRVISILNLISEHPQKFSLSNISKMLNIPKSTISPILKTLIELEIIKQHPYLLTYSIGVSAFQIGQKYLENITGIDLIKSHMVSVVKECNEICQLGICHNNEVVYITKVDCEQPVKLMSSIGKSLPLYCTALGRVFLTSFSHEEIRTLYKNGIKPLTENTVNDVEKLLKIVDNDTKRGYSEEIGEVTSDARCIAFPLKINNNILAAIGISLPIFRSDENIMENIKESLKKHSKLISLELENLDIKSLV